MKKIFSVLAAAGLACSMLAGCVENNPYVVASGFVAGDSCDPASDDNEYVTMVTCDPVSGGINTKFKLQIRNMITGTTPWSGSSGGSGATFQPENINNNTVFSDEVILKCSSIDGDSSQCNGIDDIVFPIKSPIPSGGVCFGIPMDISKIASMGGETITLEAYVKYHDSGVIKGESSHVTLTFAFANGAESCSLVGEDEK